MIALLESWLVHDGQLAYPDVAAELHNVGLYLHGRILRSWELSSTPPPAEWNYRLDGKICGQVQTITGPSSRTLRFKLRLPEIEVVAVCHDHRPPPRAGESVTVEGWFACIPPYPDYERNDDLLPDVRRDWRIDAIHDTAESGWALELTLL